MSGKITKPSTFIFDTGNVVIFFEQEKVKQKLLSYSELSFDEGYRILEEINRSNIFRLGRITPEGYFELLRNLLHLKGIDYNTFCTIWNSEFCPNYQLVGTIKRLRSRVILITDMNNLHYEYLIARYPDVIGMFDNFISSCKVGISKKDPRFLELVANQYALEPSETVYIDDKEELVQSAINRGFIGVTYKTGMSLSDVLNLE